MTTTKYNPEEIIGKLYGLEIVLDQDGTVAEACRGIAVCEQTYFRWREEYGQLRTDQARRMKSSDKQSRRFRRAISDMPFEKLHFQAVAQETSEPRTAPASRRPDQRRAGRVCVAGTRQSRQDSEVHKMEKWRSFAAAAKS